MDPRPFNSIIISIILLRRQSRLRKPSLLYPNDWNILCIQKDFVSLSLSLSHTHTLCLFISLDPSSFFLSFFLSLNLSLCLPLSLSDFQGLRATTLCPCVSEQIHLAYYYNASSTTMCYYVLCVYRKIHMFLRFLFKFLSFPSLDRVPTLVR